MLSLRRRCEDSELGGHNAFQQSLPSSRSMSFEKETGFSVCQSLLVVGVGSVGPHSSRSQERGNSQLDGISAQNRRLPGYCP